MNAVKNDIEALVQKELKSANEKFPLFSSAHEASAVLREEIEELEQEIILLFRHFTYIWEDVKHNSINAQSGKDRINDMRNCAVNAAIEAIQVAAMCDKFQMSLIGNSVCKHDSQKAADAFKHINEILSQFNKDER